MNLRTESLNPQSKEGLVRLLTRLYTRLLGGLRGSRVKLVALFGMATIAAIPLAGCAVSSGSADRKADGPMTQCPPFPGWAAGLTEVTIGPMQLNPPDISPNDPSYRPPIDVPQCSVIILNSDAKLFSYSFVPNDSGYLKQVSPAIDQIAFYVIGPVGATMTVRVDVSTKGIYEWANQLTIGPGQVTN